MTKKQERIIIKINSFERDSFLGILGILLIMLLWKSVKMAFFIVVDLFEGKSPEWNNEGGIVLFLIGFSFIIRLEVLSRKLWNKDYRNQKEESPEKGGSK